MTYSSNRFLSGTWVPPSWIWERRSVIMWHCWFSQSAVSSHNIVLFLYVITSLLTLNGEDPKLAVSLLLFFPAGWYSIWRQANRITVSDRRGDAWCCSDPAASVQRETSSATSQCSGSSSSNGSNSGSNDDCCFPAEHTKERRSHCEWRGEWGTCNK